MTELSDKQRKRLARLGSDAKSAKQLNINGPFPTHRMIAKLARDMAAAVYEEWASKSDKFYEEHRSQEDYADESWPLYVEAARTTLAKMLTGPLNEGLKNSIADALVKDNALRTKRALSKLPQFFN